MTIKEIYDKAMSNKEEKWQIVLKFSNDAPVVITDADWTEGSAFLNRSKRRLNEDFELVGVDGTGDGVVAIYQTANDEKTHQYFLFVGTEFQLINQWSKKTIKKCIADTAESKKSFRTAAAEKIEKKERPNDYVMHVYGLATENGYSYMLKMDGKSYTAKEVEAVFGGINDALYKQLYGIIYALKTCARLNSVQKIIIHENPTNSSRSVWKVPLNYWKPYGVVVKGYKNAMLEYRDIFAKKGITISFKPFVDEFTNDFCSPDERQFTK